MDANSVVFVCVGDLHVKSRNPVSRIDDYCAAWRKKLAYVRAVAAKVGASAVLCSGDIFDDVPSSVNHTLVNDMIYRLHQFDRFISPPGNHDMVYRSLNRLGDTPFQSLVSAQAVQMVSTGTGCIPVWANSGAVEASVYGVEYRQEGCLAALEELCPSHRVGGVNVAVVHGFVDVAAGSHYGEPVVSYKQIVEQTGCNVVLIGHQHDSAVPQVVDGVLFLRPGAMMRGALRVEDIYREPHIVVVRVGVAKFDGAVELRGGVWVKWKNVPLPYESADKVFDLDSYKVRKEREAALTAFAGQLSAVTLDDLTNPDSVLDEVCSQVEEIEVVERVREYITRAEADVG